ncbi:MAG: hypothetical protein ONA90_02185, partial [candidate division KSB1 bacterium]|nr:hypothetical protein [candidate division KSB1 bacterium]
IVTSAWNHFATLISPWHHTSVFLTQKLPMFVCKASPAELRPKNDTLGPHFAMALGPTKEKFWQRSPLSVAK